MATVQSLISLLDGVLLNTSANVREDTKLALLNQARMRAWRVIVGTQFGQYWFGAKSQWGDSGADDYFPVFAKNTFEYSLPNDFHQVLGMHVETSSYTHIEFKTAELEEILALRGEGNDTFSTQVKYTVYGPAPGEIHLAISPPTTLEVRLYYVRTPATWTDPTDSITEFPEEIHDMIVDWAAKRAMLGINDNRFRGYENEWKQEVLSWVINSKRDRNLPGASTAYLDGVWP